MVSSSVARILVTGAGGFVGRHLVPIAVAIGHQVLAASSLSAPGRSHPRVEEVPVDRDDPVAGWSAVLSRCDVVIHLAGRAHVLDERDPVPLERYRQVNCGLAVSLVRNAAKAGVRRFVFVSSAGVNGLNSAELPFTEVVPAAPSEPYAVAKWEAEQALRTFVAQSGIELVIVRPPLVYGPDAAGNFGRLLRLVSTGLPLPLASVRNRRSMVSVWNLCDFLVCCAEHPKAAGETFLVADGDDISTPDLIRALASEMGRSAWLFPFPPALLIHIAGVVGMDSAVERLCGSFQLDVSKGRQLLGWAPPVPLSEGLARCVADRGRSTSKRD